MKKFKIGILGVGRGRYLARDFMLLGAEVVAICDSSKERMDIAVKNLWPGIAVYDDCIFRHC